MIIIKSINAQFRSQSMWQPVKANEEHYDGVRVETLVGNEDRLFRLDKTEVGFNASHEDIINVIENKIANEQ